MALKEWALVTAASLVITPAYALQPPTEPAPQGTHKAVSRWDYTAGVVGIDNIPYRKACVNSTNTKSFSQGDPRQFLKFCIRYSKYDDVGYGIYVITSGSGELLCKERCSIRMKFDSDESSEFPAVVPDNNVKYQLFITDKSVIESVRNASKMRIEVDTADDGNGIFDFDIAGFSLEPDK